MTSSAIARAVRNQVWVAERARLLSQYTDTRRARWALMRAFARLYVRDRLGRPARAATVMRLRGGVSVGVRDHTEALVLCEVFVDECYAMPGLPATAETVVDLGCNMGATLVWFARRYPQARIVGVEADPATAELARANTRSLPQVEVLNVAIAGADGTVDLWRRPGASWASSLDSSRGERVRVDAITIPALLDRLGMDRVDVLKVDIEGAEHDAFEPRGALDRSVVIAGEYHPRAGETWESFTAKMPGFSLQTNQGARPDHPVEFIATRDDG